MDEDLKKLKSRVAQWERDTDGASYCMACENLYALISAAERERELVEALRPFAVWAERMPEGSYEVTSDIINVVGNAIANRHLTGAHFRNAARVVQAKDPTP